MEDIGKKRAEVTHPQVAKLNTYVPITFHTENLTQNFIKKFQVYES